MGARDPAGGSIVTNVESPLSPGGPFGTVLAAVLFAAVVVVVVTGLEAALAPLLPRWLVLLVAAVIVGAGLWGLLRFNEWRRSR